MTMKINMPSSLGGSSVDPSIPAPVAAPGTEPVSGAEPEPGTEPTQPLWATEPASAAPARAR